MKTDKIENVMYQALSQMKAAIECEQASFLNSLNSLFGTLFHAYCSLEKLEVEKELLKAEAEKERGGVSVNELVIGKITELLNDV